MIINTSANLKLCEIGISVNIYRTIFYSKRGLNFNTKYVSKTGRQLSSQYIVNNNFTIYWDVCELFR